MKEKTVDELFEELGYKKIRDDERFIKYRKSHAINKKIEELGWID